MPTNKKIKLFLEHRHSPVCIQTRIRPSEKERERRKYRAQPRQDRQMRAVGQESKYRGLVHPFATPLVPFILRLTRPLAESILPRISFSRIYMSRCSKSMKYRRAPSRWTHISLQFTREAPFILSRLPIRGRGDKDSWIAVCLSRVFLK